MNSANHIIRYLNLKPAEPVIRHGDEVEYIEFNDNQIDVIIHYLKECQENDYHSVAIISKTEEESTKINNELANKGIVVENISNTDTKYNGGICTIPSHLAKGLEFDSVLISDASEKNYHSDKSIDMKLLYVAMTRPLHELKVLYSGELCKPLCFDDEKIRVKKINY